MELVSKFFRKIYAESYVKIINTDPALWGYLYDRMDRIPQKSPISRFIRTLDRLNLKKVKKFIEDFEPDAIICTHFLPVELLSRMKRKGKFIRPVWIQITDFDIHTLWMHNWVNGYFCPSEEVALRIIDRGVSSDRVFVTGIPIMPAFGEKYDRATCACELGISPEKTTFLMMSGGYGVKGTEQITEALLSLRGDFQIIALAGKNEKLLESLKRMAVDNPKRLFPLGFTNTIERVMSASDLAITKAGGLTISECLAVGLPMILVSTIPGQEERNATYLLENGAALRAYDPTGLKYRIGILLESPEKLKTLRQNSMRLSRPNAALDVLRYLLND